jgi:di/tricarboxylate transporter
VLVVHEPDALRRQLVPLGAGARRTLVALAAMVVAIGLGLVPAAVAGAAAATAIVLLGVLGADQAFRAISWTTVVLVAGLLPLSTALQETGVADDLASVLLDVIGDGGGRLLLAAIFVLAAAFSVAIANTATALILLPVATSAAATLGIAIEPVLMSLAIASSASFLTPISTPGNLMIMDPAGYRFGDYWRYALPMLALFFVVAVFLVPLIWPL